MKISLKQCKLKLNKPPPPPPKKKNNLSLKKFVSFWNANILGPFILIL